MVDTSTSTTQTTKLKIPWCTLLLLWSAVSCCKFLLVPSYRSTDFDVHRNWLAVTRHLPLDQWYYDTVNGTTVHTLDYPPSFAYFEWFLSHFNLVTDYLLLTHNYNYLDDRCFALLPDSDNTPSTACIVFQRSTVIVSDVVLWWGAWIASTCGRPHSMMGPLPASFVLIVLHPGLLWLDHVHFQYNGMLFGLFLASIGYLMHDNIMDDNNNNNNNKCSHQNWIKAAVLFALLLTMKHLFVTLAPFYGVYMFRRYCLETEKDANNSNNNNKTASLSFQPRRFFTLAAVTGTTLVLPFVPFRHHLPQVASRLFPFGRGLVHEYWAANVWALYSLAQKIIVKGNGKALGLLLLLLPDDVSAAMCALLLVVALVPGLYCGWKAAAQRDNAQLLLAVVYAALSSFQVGFHVHEKAILNAMIPLTLLVVTMNNTTTTTTTTTTNNNKIKNQLSNEEETTISIRFLFLQIMALGLLGLFPLLFRPVELPLKLSTYIGYMALCYHVVMEQQQPSHNNDNNNNTVVVLPRFRVRVRRKSIELGPMTGMIGCIIVILEFLPSRVFGKLEFLPLLITSVGCALGLVLCWIRLLLIVLVVKS